MLLDTNALSAWAEDDAVFYRVLRSDRPWYLSSIVLGEFRFGLLKSNRRTALEAWLDHHERICTVLCPDEETASIYARLRFISVEARRVIPYHDLWIAALAEQYRIPVVSRDSDFDLFPSIRRLGW